MASKDFLLSSKAYNEKVKTTQVHHNRNSRHRTNYPPRNLQIFFDNFSVHIIFFINDTTKSIWWHAFVVHDSFEPCDVSKNVLEPSIIFLVFAFSTQNVKQISACCFHIIVEFLTILLGLQNLLVLCLKVRYSDRLPMVLHGVKCTIWGEKKIGVFGHTWSGKSTLIQAMFHMVDLVGGRIVIDGLDISTIGLHDLRSRLSIIPQDPTLFEGTVRGNLDPLGEHSHTKVNKGLNIVK